MRRRSDMAAFEALLDQQYEVGRQHGLYGRQKALGYASSRHAHWAYEAGWHDGNQTRRSIANRLRADADLGAAIDDMIAEVES